ncbi:DUF1804 family protein [Azospirillum sp. RWY-5-1]|uniref:DUF1804 family protein n=1 Tax=Azospirillum oleiclasticum TaxID=2735135 RepID=A0ABX2TMA7_9PROT|nr:DUF1804 family protein [Azospirillum oleiclasticum]NYZ17054.1 DUF1804 family protein [Azospirillum oleiclasticum]NYZ24502.1 DUF1804 family protein [Azospirillum oleiclasticum]
MAHGADTRADLRRAYVYDRLELPAAAERLGVSLSSARRWKQEAEADGDDWDRARSAARLAGDGRQQIAEMILNDYLLLHQACVEDIKGKADIDPLKKAEVLSRLADAFNKTMAAVGRASPELSRLAVATDVIQRLAGFVRRDFPHLAPALLEVIEPFSAELSRDYG